MERFFFSSSPSFFRLLNKATRSEKKKVKVTDPEICQAPLIFISPALEWRRPSRRLPLEERQSERPPELPAVSRATPSIHTSFLPHPLSCLPTVRNISVFLFLELPLRRRSAFLSGTQGWGHTIAPHRPLPLLPKR